MSLAPSIRGRKQDVEHVLSISCLSEPEPNRIIRETKSPIVRPSSPSSTPLPSAALANSRITNQQHNVATRKIAQFMRSILVRPIPVHINAPGNKSQNLAPHAVLSPIEAYTHSINGVVACFSGILSPDQQTGAGNMMKKVEGQERENKKSTSKSCLLELPLELLDSIISRVDDLDDLLGVSRVCVMLRSRVLLDHWWKASFCEAAMACDLGQELLLRNDSTPLYLRYFAIKRWYGLYQETKALLQKLKPENRPSAAQKEELEVIFGKMTPNSSPWVTTAYSMDQIVVKLPNTISVLELNQFNALQVFIHLDSGAYYYELMNSGCSTTLEFHIYRPSEAHPTIKLITPHLYHPLLDPETQQLRLPHLTSSLSPSEAPSAVPATWDVATNIERLILSARDCFTSLNSIASDFTL